MKEIRENIGLFLVIGSVLAFFSFGAYAGIYRFAHPELTETQLYIWAFAYWWAWLLPVVVAGFGWWMFTKKSH